MHQTFYIDIDEEITSIVEKLRKTEAPEAVIVVPKRALLIQSIVNLKLLKKEADSLGLKIGIVTQDKLGKMLVKKAGISLQQKLEDDLEELEVADNERAYQPRKELKQEIDPTELGEVNSRRKRDLEKIGSANYFTSGSREESSLSNVAGLPASSRETLPTGWEELEELKEREIIPESSIGKSQKINTDNELNVPIREVDYRKKNTFAMDVAGPVRPPASKSETFRTGIAMPARSFAANTFRADNDSVALGGGGPNKKAIPSLAPDEFAEIPYSSSRKEYQATKQQEDKAKSRQLPKDDQLERFFYANNFSEKGRENYADKKQELAQKTEGGFLKTVAILGGIVLAGGLLYGAYFYVPKAVVTIFAKKEVKSSDLVITGDTKYDNVDYDKSIISAKLLEFNEEVVKTFDATGSKNVSNQKAKGKITIYNEFSSSAQPLVATTRFLSEDQKTFRLAQGVTIPGTTKVGGEIKPGVVEAEVIADESGDSYNISATSFTIPGFKNSGNEKYAKIYAKSSASMIGGGGGNDAVKIVSAKDISDAKDKISLEISSEVKKKIKDSAEAGIIILDDAIIIDEPMYRVSNAEGEIASSFEIKAQAHAQAIVFSEGDVKKIANSVIAKSGNGKINIDSGAILIDYGKSDIDLTLGTIEIKVHASNIMQPNIKLENIKKDILGKNNEQLAEYLKTYANIEKVEVEYFPQLFISKIPTNEKRVEVNLDATMPE